MEGLTIVAFMTALSALSIVLIGLAYVHRRFNKLEKKLKDFDVIPEEFDSTPEGFESLKEFDK